MPWKTHGNHRYYYRSVRVGSKVRTQYFGGGLAGELAAQIDHVRRKKRERHRQQVRELQARLQRLADDVLGFCSDVNVFTRASLVAGGYYHHRGNWRMRMAMKTDHDAPLPSEADMNALVELANQGHAGALAELRNTLDEHPEIWRKLGDLGQHVENALVAAICPGNALIRESLQRQLAEMKSELISTETPLLERMAAQRIIVCWLEVQMTDANYPEAASNFILQRKQVAQNRFAKAIRTLELVRQMPLARRSTAAPGKRKKNNGEARRRKPAVNRLGVYFDDEVPVGSG